MTEGIQTEEDVCRPATAREVELLEWAEEAHRNSLGVLTESLRQLVTLSAAILGGSAALYNQIPVSQSCKAVFFVLLLGVLGVSLWGAYPLTATVLYMEDVQAAREKWIVRRSRYLAVASLLLFIAFAYLAGSVLSVLK